MLIHLRREVVLPVAYLALSDKLLAILSRNFLFFVDIPEKITIDYKRPTTVQLQNLKLSSPSLSHF